MKGRRPAGLRVYGDVDQSMGKLIKDARVTCKRGCAACCHFQLVTLTMAEALIIADEVLATWSKGKIVQLEGALALRVEQLERLRPGRPGSRPPCVFLEQTEDQGAWTGLCSIYPSRPLICRLHYVTSDPILCQPNIYREDQTAMLDTGDLQHRAMLLLAESDPALATFGPFDPWLLYALRWLRDGTGPGGLALVAWRRRLRQWLAHDRRALERIRRGQEE